MANGSSTPPATESYALPSGFLTRTRFVWTRYSPRLIDAIRTCENPGYVWIDWPTSRSLSRRGSRVEAEHGVPFLQGSHVVHFQPADLTVPLQSQVRTVDCPQRMATGLLRHHRANHGLPASSGTVGQLRSWNRRPDEKKCPDGYLCAFLSSPFGQAQLTANIYGAVVDELTEEQAGGIEPTPKTASDRALVRSIDSREGSDRTQIQIGRRDSSRVAHDRMRSRGAILRLSTRTRICGFQTLHRNSWRRRMPRRD